MHVSAVYRILPKMQAFELAGERCKYLLVGILWGHKEPE